MTRLTESMHEEIQEILCELLEVEPFELDIPSLLARRCTNDRQQALSVRSTLERAFGVTIADSELSRMVDLPGVYDVVDTAIAGKRRRAAALVSRGALAAPRS